MTAEPMFAFPPQPRNRRPEPVAFWRAVVAVRKGAGEGEPNKVYRAGNRHVLVNGTRLTRHQFRKVAGAAI